MKDIVPSVNFHLWKPCNFRCKFCFATFQDEMSLYSEKSHLSKDEMLQIIDEIVKQKITKITFVGGEPLLCKWLPDLIRYSKQKGLTTMIVTNGYLLTDEWLDRQEGNLDWVTLSIDTIDPERQIQIGRSNGKKIITAAEYKDKIKSIKKRNIKFKLNTVVCSINVDEDFSDFVKEVSPERWKIFQVLPVEGQNDKHINDFIISDKDFQNYVERHKLLQSSGIQVVTEDNDQMRGSYLMIDPQGRLYDNVNGKHSYSESILKIGFTEASNQVEIDKEKFFERGGSYKW